MLWELYQHGRIRRAQQDASGAGATARSASRDVAELQRSVQLLEEQVERLTLAAIALAEILRDRQGVSEEEMEAKLREIDLRDGQADGKLGPSTRKCEACGRPNGPRRRNCLYCGGQLPDESILFGTEPKS
jgi:hypothetical protein